jgi:hypothetical protein
VTAEKGLWMEESESMIPEKQNSFPSATRPEPGRIVSLVIFHVSAYAEGSLGCCVWFKITLFEVPRKRGGEGTRPSELALSPSHPLVCAATET